MRPRINRLKQKLRAGEIAVGVNVQTASPEIVEMVGAAGYDYAMLDWEHGSYGFDALVHMIRAAEAFDLTTIVRVPDASPTNIMRVLDAGAMGVVIPQVAATAEADAAVRAARYSDGMGGGNRGTCPSVGGGENMATHQREFRERRKKERFIALGFESDDALDNFDGLAAIPGVDAIFIGAFDWAQSIGCYGEMYHPDNMQRIRKLAALSAGRGIQIFATLVSGDAEEAAKDMAMWKELGARIVNAISDRRILTLGLAQRLQAVQPG
ncbi:aldolase/citrate lyase family protein [soil metagenome]